jgi:chromosome segregation ATPase
VGEGNQSLRARLYRMHGEGQISEEVFDALRVLADRGQLRPADLAVHLARARRGGSEGGDAAIGNALRGIRSRHAKLVQARVGTEKVLADLEAHLSELDECMAAKQQAARQSVTQNEETARQRLAEKAELAGSRQRLAAQAQALRADLARLYELNLQLEAKSAELEAVQARHRLGAEMIK